MSEYSFGMEVVFSNMDKHYRELSEEVDGAIQGAGIDCQAETKRECPVGTPESTGIKGYKGGRLRASYQYMRKWLESYVYTNVKYSVWVELGTVRMRAKPHLFPGFLYGARNLLAELKSIGVGR